MKDKNTKISFDNYLINFVKPRSKTRHTKYYYMKNFHFIFILYLLLGDVETSIGLMHSDL